MLSFSYACAQLYAMLRVPVGSNTG